MTPEMDPTTVAIIAIIVAAGSEIIAISPLKSNSWLQLVMQMLRLAFPKRRP
jgi:hypothetical protein